MRRCCFGLFAGAMVLVILAGSAAASPLSPRLRRIQEAWRAASVAEVGPRVPALAPYLSRAVDGISDGSAAPGKEPSVRVLVTLADPGVLEPAGFAPRTVARDVATVNVPISRLDDLASLPGVVHADVSLPVKLLLDASTTDIQSNLVNGSEMPPYPGYTGAGVVVGFVDSGIDFNHEDFKLDGGDSRIACIWDQGDDVGPHPDGFGYGTVWLQKQITDGLPRQRDTIGHGTHVSGIAAGNGRASDIPEDVYKFAGVAPEATIAMVNTIFDEASLVDGVAWIHEMALEMGYPSVVNMSLGNQFGPHDGTSSLDRAVGNQSGEGRILVAAAGNEQGDRIHAETTIAPSAKVSFLMNVGSYSPWAGSANEIISVEAWYEGVSNLRFTVKTPRNLSVGPVSPSNSVAGLTTIDGRVDLEHATYPVNQDKYVLLDIWDQSAEIRSGTWTVEVENISSTQPAEVDFWIAGVDVGQVPGAVVQWTTFEEDAEVINSPAGSPDVICAGAHVTKTSWLSKDGNGYQYGTVPPILGDIAPFSSPGPLRTGVVKPDFSAPGMGVASAKASTAPAGSSFNTVPQTTPDCFHVMATGTSMATPHIAGAVALLLEAATLQVNAPSLAPASLTPEEVLGHLERSARSDGHTGTVPNSLFGKGKVDAQGALDDLMTPVRLLAITAGWEEDRAIVRWTLVETEPGSRFRIDRAPTPRGPFVEVGALVGSDLSFVWEDPEPDAAAPWYRVSVTTRDGTPERFGPVRLETRAGLVRLLQNAPNPFSEATRVAFEIDAPQPVSLDVLDSSGRLVTTLARAAFDAGRHEVSWDGTDRSGAAAASGVYFLRLSTIGSVEVRRIQRVR